MSSFVSVIIPVLNDAKRLQICLQALEQQTYLQNSYEVIVVDNGSDAAENITGIVMQFGQATIAHEPTPGSYAARNKGITLAKGDIIAFTDSDCIPATDWIEQGVRQLQQTENCGLVAGKIELFYKNPEQPTSIELYEQITAFPQQKLLQTKHFGATGNLFTFKRVIEDVGLFNPKLKSNGDLEWGQRVFNRNYQQAYAENVRVQHPARYSFKQLYKRTVRLAGGSYDLQRSQEQSKVKENLAFGMSLIKSLAPPLNFVFNTFLNSQIKGAKNKLDVSWVMFFVRYISAWELLRLRLGKPSSRE